MQTINVNIQNIAALSAVVHNIHAAARQNRGVTVNLVVNGGVPVEVKEVMASAMKEQSAKDKEAMEAAAAAEEARRAKARKDANRKLELDGAIAQAGQEAERKAIKKGVDVNTREALVKEAEGKAEAKVRAKWAKQDEGLSGKEANEALRKEELARKAEESKAARANHPANPKAPQAQEGEAQEDSDPDADDADGEEVL